MKRQQPGRCPTCGFPHEALAELLAPVIARIVADVIARKIELTAPATALSAATPNNPSERRKEAPTGPDNPELEDEGEKSRKAPVACRRGSQSSPTGGGAAGDSRTQRIAQRVREYLGAQNTSIHRAWRELGVSEPTLYNLLREKGVSPASLRKIEQALDALKREARLEQTEKPAPARSGKFYRKQNRKRGGAPDARPRGSYSEDQVERLATTWAPDAGVNRIPDLNVKPARCGPVP